MTLLVAGLSMIGPLLEGTLGDGRGWTIGLVFLLVFPSLTRAGGPRFHPLDPETYVPATYFLSVGYAPVLSMVTRYGFSLPSHEVAAMQAAYAGAVGCAIVCTALSRVWEPPHTERMVPTHRPRAMLDQDWATITVGLLGLALVAAWIASIGVGRFFTMSYADNHLEEDGKGLLTSGWHLVRIAIVYCFLRLVSARKAGVPVPKMLSLAGLAFLVSFLLNTIIGRRGPIIWAVLSIGLALHAYGVRLRRRWLALGMVAVVVYGTAMEGARNETGSGFDAQIEMAITHLERKNLLEIGELEAIYNNLVTIVNERPPIVSYPGESWVNAFLILVPKPLWSERPLGLSARYVMFMAPDKARHGAGFAMSAAAEGYVNLGLLGTAIEVALFSALFFMMPLNVAAARDAPLLTRATAACLASFAYNQFRGELTSMIKIALSLGIAMVAVMLITPIFRYLRGWLAAIGPARHRPERSLRSARLGQPSTPGR